MRNAINSQVIVSTYQQAFAGHYPAAKIEIVPKKQQSGNILWDVQIDGASGKMLTLQDMQDAIKLFAR